MSPHTHPSDPRPIPARAGIGLRTPHLDELLTRRPPLGFLEVHAENHFGDGGAPLDGLERVAAHYPLSVHGVGLSLGSVDALDGRHLDRLAALVRRFDPLLVSEHLCWSSVDGVHLNDLLPLPCTEEALVHVVERIEQVQQRLARPLLVENVSSYLRYTHSTIPEPEFLAEVARRSGCRILLDVNNVYVSASNLGFDPVRYIDELPADAVAEIHLGGHAVNRRGPHTVLIDDHGSRIREPVWALYGIALARFGRCPTLVEWDSDVPELDVLLDEAAHADRIAGELRARTA